MKKNQPIIGIIGGNGKMGQWFRTFFEQKSLSVFVAGRNTKLTPIDLAKKSDIIIVSVPISEIEKVVQTIMPYIKKNSLLTDIASLKIITLDVMKNAECETLGMHPLFGPSITTNIGQKIVFCKQKSNKYVDFLKKLFQQSGITVIEMTAEEHDYQMAYIQALTHAINLMLAKTILVEEKNSLSTKLYTPTFSLQSLVMGRIMQQDLRLMADMQLHNPYFIPILDIFVEQGKNLLKILQNNTSDEFIQMFDQEQKLTKNFASFSTFQTNKILQQISEIQPSIPQKLSSLKNLKSGKVAYLGPEGTYSHQAALTVFPKDDYKKTPYGTLFEIFDSVSNNDVQYGIVPAENSIEGTVRGTLDYLVDSSLFVAGSFELPVHHQLLSNEKKLEEVKVVVSHPQALAQCKSWLNKNLPNAKIISSSSTTSGIKSNQKGYAYISSFAAAKKYNISILRKNIEDNSANATRFYVLVKKPLKLKGLNNSRTLLFLTVYNRVGILRDILDVLAKYDLNLTKLESRPSHEKLWDYHFFVEIEKKFEDPYFAKAIKELEAYCPVIRMLGQT